MTVRIEARAGAVVCGRALERPGLRVVNPDLEICIAPRNLILEVRLERGYGLRLAAQPKDAGFWSVAAWFAPVRRVDLIVTRARVGQRVDFDSLRLHVRR